MARLWLREQPRTGRESWPRDWRLSHRSECCRWYWDMELEWYFNLSPATQKRKHFANVIGDVDVWTLPFNQAHIASQVILCLAFQHFSISALTDQFSRLSTKFHRKIIALGTQPESRAQKTQLPTWHWTPLDAAAWCLCMSSVTFWANPNG